MLTVRHATLTSTSFFRSAREGPKVSHYIINVSDESSKLIYRIGDKTFFCMKDLLNFYKQRLLDTSPLVQIVSVVVLLLPPPQWARRSVHFLFSVSQASRANEVQIRRQGKDPRENIGIARSLPTLQDEEDLPFKKGQILMVIKKVEPLWWLARDTNGEQGMIPANYVEYLR